MTTAHSLRQKHPAGLRVLFMTELWERFGFYIVHGILVLYLTRQLNLSDQLSQDIVGAVIALIYITPIIGGALADRILGFRIAVIWGGILLALAYFFLAIPTYDFFYIGIALQIVGSGFLKSSISSLVGTLYKENDVRLVSGFTLFYMGINTGVILAYLIGPYVADNYSFHLAFGLASIGMLLGLFTFIKGLAKLDNQGLPPSIVRLQSKIWGFPVRTWIILGTIIAIMLITQVINYSDIANKFVMVFGAVAALYLLWLGFKETKIQRNRIIALLILLIISTIFQAIYFQIYSSLVLFIDRQVDRDLQLWNDISFMIPTASFGTLLGIFIVASAPLLARLWTYLSEKQRMPSYPAKFSMALLFIGIALIITATSVAFFGKAGIISLHWIVLIYFCIVMGEMLISPIALAATSELVPQRLSGMAMGIYFASLGIGGALSSSMANIVAIPTELIGDAPATALIYQAGYYKIGTIVVVLGVIGLVVSPLIQRLIKPKSSL